MQLKLDIILTWVQSLHGQVITFLQLMEVVGHSSLWMHLLERKAKIIVSASKSKDNKLFLGRMDNELHNA